MNIIATKHAEQRAKERAGLPAKSVKRIALKALNNGIEDIHLKGEISGWVFNKLNNHSESRKFFLYGDKAWVFSPEDDNYILVTLLQLPSGLVRKVKNISA